MGEGISACTARLVLLLKPLDVVSARPLELLPLCSGIVCRSSLCDAACAAGLVATGEGLVGRGGLDGTGFRRICASAGTAGAGIRFLAELCSGGMLRPKTGDSSSSGSETSVTECKLE